MRNRGSDYGALFWMVAAFVIILGSCFGPAVGTDANDAISVAEDQGYTNVVVNGSNWFTPGFAGCSEKDGRAVNVTATNANGERVDLTVCLGWPFKGSTIRS